MPLPSIPDLANALNLPLAKAEKFIKYYNTHMQEYGNEIYAKVESRIAHWKNFADQGWFTKRLNYYLDHAAEYDLVVDLGFSVPHPYFSEDLLASETRFVFIDNQASARAFYDKVSALAELGHRLAIDTVLHADIEKGSDHDLILACVRQLKPRRLLIVASEILEHLNDLDSAWKLIRFLERLPTVEFSRVYITLPVGKKIPSHTIELLKIEEARALAHKYMKIEKEEALETPDDSYTRALFYYCYCALGTTRADQGLE